MCGGTADVEAGGTAICVGTAGMEAGVCSGTANVEAGGTAICDGTAGMEAGGTAVCSGTADVEAGDAPTCGGTADVEAGGAAMCGGTDIEVGAIVADGGTADTHLLLFSGMGCTPDFNLFICKYPFRNFSKFFSSLFPGWTISLFVPLYTLTVTKVPLSFSLPITI